MTEILARRGNGQSSGVTAQVKGRRRTSPFHSTSIDSGLSEHSKANGGGGGEGNWCYIEPDKGMSSSTKTLPEGLEQVIGGFVAVLLLTSSGA